MIFVFESYQGKFLDKFGIGSKVSDLSEYVELEIVKVSSTHPQKLAEVLYSSDVFKKQGRRKQGLISSPDN
ncbi:MAG: hypothetical protein V7K33_00735 [Nostoc sp.]